MIRRLIILDSALVVLLAFGSVRFRQDWRAFEPAHQVSAIQAKPEALPNLPVNANSVAGGPADWSEIPSRNPFSFDRTDIAIIAAPEPTVPAGPKPVLFGTMMIGSEKLAMLASAQPNNRNYRPLKVGDKIDGWTLVGILDKSVVIEWNSSRETVIMNDPSAAIPRDYTTRTTAAASAAPVVIQPPAAPSITAPPMAPAPPGARANPAPAQKRVIQTPFGPKVVEDPQ